MNKEQLTAFSDAGIAFGSISPALACADDVLLAAIWPIPDRRIERVLR